VITAVTSRRPVHRDITILMVTRLLRASAFGFGGVLLAFHLRSRALSATEIGAGFAIGVAAAALSGLLAAIASGRFGRRRTLAAIGLLMALCGLDLAVATQPWLLMLAGLTGMMGIAGTDQGPFLVVEQAVLAQTATAGGRNRAFARYSLTGAIGGAAGGLAAGTSGGAARSAAFFVVFALLGIATAILPFFLTSAVESDADAPVFGRIRPLVGLTALFALDSLGGGLVANAVVAYWLQVRFGATPLVIGVSFAIMSIVTAASFLLAGRLADRIGLINTMVATHLPGNLLLLLVPLAPSLGWTLGLLIARSAVNSMDQPARQAYVVSIVKPNERSGALAITGTLRGLVGSVGPLITGLAIQSASLGLPFFAAGTAKSLYDIGLYLGYRNRRGDDETWQKAKVDD